ncbi:MAG: tyrosine-type recombinase/integrase [Microcoleaceae cyanobacterium]
MKNNRSGAAAIITDLEYEKIYENLSTSQQKLILSLLRYTGERIGAVIQLKVTDCYSTPWDAKPLPEITYKALTRKRSAGKDAKTRQIPVSRALYFELNNYQPPPGGFLFPSPQNLGCHVTRQWVDLWFRKSLKASGLARRGISLHSPRRTLITKLAQEGVPVPVIRAITGHQSIDVLIRHYVENDEQTIKRAMELI